MSMSDERLHAWQDAVAKHTRAINAVPELIEALVACIAVMSRELDGLKSIQPELQTAREAYYKATGEKYPR